MVLVYSRNGQYVIKPSLSNAVASADSIGKTIVVTEPITTNSITIPDTMNLRVERGGVITIASGHTMTINSPFECGLYQAFSLEDATASVVFGSDSVESVPTEWFGADDDVALQKAIDACPSNRAVVISGAKTLTTTITVNTQNLNIIGNSYNPYVNYIECVTASTLMFDVTTSGVTFSGLSFKGDGSTYGASATVNGVRNKGYISGSDNGSNCDALFENCVFTNLNKCVEQQGKNISYRNCLFSNSLYGIYLVENSSVAVSDFRGVDVVGCRFHSMGGTTTAYGIYQSTGANNLKDVLINGSYFDDSYCAVSGYFVNLNMVGSMATRMKGAAIVNLDMTGVTTSADLRQINITGNEFSYSSISNTGYGLHLKGLTFGQIANNLMSYTGYHGIYCESVTGGIEINNNTFRACGADTGAAYDTIYLDSSTQACSIVGNKISRGTNNTRYGVNVAGYGSSFSSANYIGTNSFTNYTTGTAYNIARNAASHNIGESDIISNLDVIDVAPFGNVDGTFVLGQDSPNFIHTTAITADRTLTLSDTNVYDGGKCRVTRTSTGAFNLNIKNSNGDTLKALAANTWAEFMWAAQAAGAGASYTGWKLIAYGSL